MPECARPLAFAAGEPVGAAVARLSEALAAAGIATPRLDARLLARHATGLDALALATRGGEALSAAAAGALEAAARRRLAREPIARILGGREFFGLFLELGPATLEPRPDSETLVEAVLELTPEAGAGLRLLDLGTGSGCLLLAILANRPRATGIGVDRSFDAARVARANARAHGLEDRAAFVVADWATALAGPFDVVLSNPPYIESAVVDGLDPEVREHDPRAALDGGADGLAAYRAIIADAARLLAPGGHLVFELGAGQAAAVAALLAAAGFGVAGTRRDLGGHERVIVARAPNTA